jgi:hypothetical protein
MKREWQSTVQIVATAKQRELLMPGIARRMSIIAICESPFE